MSLRLVKLCATAVVLMLFVCNCDLASGHPLTSHTRLMKRDSLKVVRERSVERLKELRHLILPKANWSESLKQLLVTELKKRKTFDKYTLMEAKLVMELEKENGLRREQPSSRRNDMFFFSNRLLSRRKRHVKGSVKRVKRFLKKSLPPPNSTRVTLLTTIILRSKGKAAGTRQVQLTAPLPPAGGGAVVKFKVDVNVELLPSDKRMNNKTTLFPQSTKTVVPTTTTTSAPPPTTTTTTVSPPPQLEPHSEHEVFAEEDYYAMNKWAQKCSEEDISAPFCFFGGECVQMVFQTIREKLCRCKPGYKGNRCEFYDILTSINEFDSAEQLDLIGQGKPLPEDIPSSFNSVLDATADYLAETEDVTSFYTVPLDMSDDS